jgi:hypothetical protein
MRIASKSKEHIRHIHKLFLQKSYYEMCNEIWYYGEFDFFFDYCKHLQYKYNSEKHRSDMYNGVVDIFFTGHYNANLMNPIQGEPRRDTYLDFILGTEKNSKSIKELLG